MFFFGTQCSFQHFKSKQIPKGSSEGGSECGNRICYANFLIATIGLSCLVFEINYWTYNGRTDRWTTDNGRTDVYLAINAASNKNAHVKHCIFLYL